MATKKTSKTKSGKRTGRPLKAADVLMRETRLTICFPPEVADQVRQEADRQLLGYSAFVRALVLKELRRLERQREKQAAA